MSALTKQQFVKVIFAASVLVLLVLTEPTIAKEDKRSRSRPQARTQKTQQVRKSSASRPQRSPQIQQSSQRSRPQSTPRIKASSPRPPTVSRQRTNISTRSFNQSQPVQHQQRITPSRNLRVTSPKVSAPKVFQRPASPPIERRTIPSSIIRKPATIRAGTQISSNTQLKIGRSIGSMRDERAAESNRIRISLPNRISSEKTSAIASPIRPANIVERRKDIGNLLDNTRNSRSSAVTGKSRDTMHPVIVAGKNERTNVSTSIGSKEKIGESNIFSRKHPRVWVYNRSNGESKTGTDKIKPEKSVRDELRGKSRVTPKLPEKRPKAVLPMYRDKKAEVRESEKKSGGSARKGAVPREPAISTEPKRGKDNRGKRSDVKPAVPRNRETVHPRKDTSIAGRSRYKRRRYEEQRDVVTNIHRNRHIHTYRDRYHRICNRIVWPRYHFPVYYSYGPYFTFRYVYPYYHRRYVFVSLGGYWPSYNYIRYYWYGYHPYEWYGYQPVSHQVQNDTYNYYTYNYYYNDSQAGVSGEPAGTLRPVDENTFADVRERLAQQQAEEPDAQTLADTYFEDAVNAFEKGDYDTAAELFAKAMELAPEDVILPFAFAQTLFAAEQYTDAAEVLRLTLAGISPEEEGVFYPRGLYPEEEILFEQIDVLAEKAALNSSDLNLQLLLGYHLLGIGELEEALEPLQLAASDKENAAAAKTLLDLLVKLRTAEKEGQ